MTYQPPVPPPYRAQPDQSEQPYFDYYQSQPMRHPRFYQKGWFWVILVAVMSIGGCAVVFAAVDTPAGQVENAEHIVIYEMTSDGTKASITYASVTGDGTLGVEQVAEAPTPFLKQLSVNGDFSAYSLVGQAGDGTTITCRITIDSVVIVEQTSTGEFSIVLCAGSLPR